MTIPNYREHLVRGMIPEMIRRNMKWGNVANLPIDLDEERIEAIGLNGAIREYMESRRDSEHLASSGLSDEMTRGPRKEHYRRKGVLEGKKEQTRRRKWAKLYPGRGESNWDKREELRKQRKKIERNTRKKGKN